jgi:hypothetical protein
MRPMGKFVWFFVDLAILSRRDLRTKPGVLTPGMGKKESRPEGAEDDRCALTSHSLPLSAAPSGRVLFLRYTWG